MSDVNNSSQPDNDEALVGEHDRQEQLAELTHKMNQLAVSHFSMLRVESVHSIRRAQGGVDIIIHFVVPVRGTNHFFPENSHPIPMQTFIMPVRIELNPESEGYNINFNNVNHIDEATSALSMLSLLLSRAMVLMSQHGNGQNATE